MTIIKRQGQQATNPGWFAPSTPGATAPSAPPAASFAAPRLTVGTPPRLGAAAVGGPPVIGSAYTGAAIRERHLDTGKTRIAWAGEMHGAWEGDTDPASDLIADLDVTERDGHVPAELVLTGPNPHDPNGTIEYVIALHIGERARAAGRKAAREDAAKPKPTFRVVEPRDLRRGDHVLGPDDTEIVLDTVIVGQPYDRHVTVIGTTLDGAPVETRLPANQVRTPLRRG